MPRKHDIRRTVAERKRQHTEEELRLLSLAATRMVLADRYVKEARTILLYYSMRDEVDTHLMVETLHNNGKTVLLPRVVDDCRMELVRYSGRDCLREAGRFHIMEPQGDAFDRLAEIDTAIVPGVAFTIDGRRMGRGRGYYDRLLPKLANAHKTGLCFPFQIFDDIPVTRYDVLMDEVLFPSSQNATADAAATLSESTL